MEWREMPGAGVFDVGRPCLALSPRRQVLGNIRLWPVIHEVAHARALPVEGVVAAEDRLLDEGLAVNLAFLRRGYYPAVRPAGPGRYRVALAPPERQIAEPVCLIGGDLNGNYYHWLFDYLPRLLAAARHGDVLAPDGRLRLAIAAPRPAYVAELLALAGLQDCEIIDLQDGGSPLFHRLYVISNFTQYGFVHPVTPSYLPPPPPGPGRRRLYVSRADAATRRLANEEQVLAALAPFGIERVVPGGLGLAEQRRLFAEAELVVGPHGAGLANLLWAPAACPLVELRPEVQALWQYERLCTATARPYCAALAPPPQCRRPGDANTDYVLRPETVAAAVRHMLGIIPIPPMK